MRPPSRHTTFFHSIRLPERNYPRGAALIEARRARIARVPRPCVTPLGVTAFGDPLVIRRFNRNISNTVKQGFAQHEEAAGLL